jgi:hypothetical protein
MSRPPLHPHLQDAENVACDGRWRFADALVNQCDFAGSARAYDGQRLFRLNMKRDAVDQRPSRQLVAKLDILGFRLSRLKCRSRQGEPPRCSWTSRRPKISPEGDDRFPQDGIAAAKPLDRANISRHARGKRPPCRSRPPPQNEISTEADGAQACESDRKIAGAPRAEPGSIPTPRITTWFGVDTTPRRRALSACRKIKASRLQQG